MEKKNAILMFVGVLVAILLAASFLTALFLDDEGKEDTKDDGIPENIDPDPGDGNETPTLPSLPYVVHDLFYTERLTSTMYSSMSGYYWLVVDLEVKNSLGREFMCSAFVFHVVTSSGSYSPSMYPEYVPGTFDDGLLPSNESERGWVHFEIPGIEDVISLDLVDGFETANNTLNLSDWDVEMRPWRSPVSLSVLEMGRDDTGPAGFAFCVYRADNVGENVTHFEVWKLQMNTTDGIKDCIFNGDPGPSDLHPGDNRTIKVYIDIPHGSDITPLTLMSPWEGITISIDPLLYEGKI